MEQIQIRYLKLALQHLKLLHKSVIHILVTSSYKYSSLS